MFQVRVDGDWGVLSNDWHCNRYKLSKMNFLFELHVY